ncbi:MAG: PAS domain S-box protein [Halodesulfurarchaeum sp.]
MGNQYEADLLQNILSAVSDPFCGLDSSLRVTRCNEAASETFQIAPDEAKGESIADLLSLKSTDAAQLKSVIDDIDRPERTGTNEETLTITTSKASGDRVDVDLMPVAKGGETVYCRLDPVQGTDSPSRALAMDDLSVFRKAVEESTDMIAALDRQKRFLFANRRYRDFHEIDEPVVGAQITDILPIETVATISSPIEQVFSTGEPLDFEMERQGPDGSIHEFHVEYYPITTQSGEIAGGVATIHDITELKHQTHALREAWETYEGLVDAIPDPILLIEPGGEIIEANQAAKQRLGYTSAGILDLSFDDLMVADRTDWIESRIRADDSEAVVFETQFRTIDGVKIPVEVAVKRIDYFTTEAMVAISHDLSEHRQYERQLESTNARLEEFTTVVTQDLRNPLTVAKGWTEIAQKAHQIKELDKIATSLDRMDEIIKYTLTLAHEGDGIGHLSKVDLNDVAWESWQAIDTHSADFKNNIESTARGDYGRIAYLFRTLFQRSVDLADTEPKIRVGELRSGSGFFVADDGPKLQMDDRGSVNYSSHLGQSESETFDLMAVKRIADAHGWNLSLKESEAGGAKFEFRGVEMNPEENADPWNEGS